jgi:hypothetical protein
MTFTNEAMPIEPESVAAAMKAADMEGSNRSRQG